MSPRLGLTVSFRRQRELRHSICPSLPAPLAPRYGLSHRQGFAAAFPADPLAAATGCVHKALERWSTFPPSFGTKSILNFIELQRTVLIEFIDELVDLAVVGLDLALGGGFSALGCSRLIQIKTPDRFPDPQKE